MAYPYNWTVSSLVVSNLDNENNSDDEFENRTISNGNEENASEISITDMDTSVIDSDYEDHGAHVSISGDGDSAAYDSIYENDASETSLQTDSDHEFEEEHVEHEAKRMKLDIDTQQSDGEESVDPSQKCPICLGAWSNTGDHRLCSLRCGHLFGYKCIRQWLNSDNSDNSNSDNEYVKKCPQCKAKASMAHIRFIYANKLTCRDYTEIEKMRKQLEEVNRKISKLSKALYEEKKRTRKYKQLFKARTLAFAADSDFCFSD